MTDTLAATEKYLDQRYRELTPGQRVEMACGMWATGVQLVRSGIRGAEPNLTEAEVRVRLLQRMYSRDLTGPALEELTAILLSSVERVTEQE